jgi:hypothetical protein
MVLLCLLAAIFAIPVIILTLCGCIVLYGVLKLNAWIVCEIWEDDLTDAWNKFVNAFTGAIDGLKELFQMEMELV